MSAKTRVLVIDDDPVIGKSIDRVLSGKGWAVITAADGPEALTKLALEDYDVVFTDIRMPGMDGVEVARRIKETRPWLPVVIVTGYGSAENEARAREAGVQAFLRKPLSPEMIEQSAQGALREKASPAAAEASAAAPAETPVPAARPGALRNVALFLAAPFIGLAYAIALPFVGIGLIAWAGYRAWRKRGSE
ncbi:MAG: response regulator [Pseudomonadota bacterium]